MKVLAVIPSRYNSSRFPAKPLAKLLGKPMIQWVYEGCQQSPLLSDIIVATDHPEIRDCVIGFGGQVEMTEEHPSGTDRVHEVASRHQAEIILNIQGDEPLVNEKTIELLLRPFKEFPDARMSTLCKQIQDKSTINNPNVVKVVRDKQQKALYFSRSVIPHPKEETSAKYYRHIGMYGFLWETLENMAIWPQSPLEKTESLEQLRLMENGHSIYCLETTGETADVNAPEDLAEVEALLKKYY